MKERKKLSYTAGEKKFTHRQSELTLIMPCIISLMITHSGNYCNKANRKKTCPPLLARVSSIRQTMRLGSDSVVQRVWRILIGACSTEFFPLVCIGIPYQVIYLSAHLMCKTLRNSAP